MLIDNCLLGSHKILDSFLDTYSVLTHSFHYMNSCRLFDHKLMRMMRSIQLKNRDNRKLCRWLLGWNSIRLSIAFCIRVLGLGWGEKLRPFILPVSGSDDVGVMISYKPEWPFSFRFARAALDSGLFRMSDMSRMQVLISFRLFIESFARAS